MPPTDCHELEPDDAESSFEQLDPEAQRLLGLLANLLVAADRPSLPCFSYRLWSSLLQYPDLAERARATTRALALQRDEALQHPSVRALVEWAGRRRRDEPIAAAAAALGTVQAAQLSAEAQQGLVQIAAEVLANVDSAMPLRPRRQRRAECFLDLDRLAAVEDEPGCASDEALHAAVSELVARACPHPSGALVTRVELAVAQAGTWWARHATPVPSALEGPHLPGVVAAQSLRLSERLSSEIDDPVLLALVAGPHPGRRRPGQLAWRRGLAFWVAVRLSEKVPSHEPGRDALAWWALQIGTLSSRDDPTDSTASLAAS